MNAGEGAIGKAQVFGNSINPLQYYIQQGAQNRAYQLQQEQYKLKRRDDLIKDLRQFNPDKVWEPFYDEVNRYAQSNVRDFTTNALAAGARPDSIIPEVEKRKGDTMTLVNKINWLKQQYNDIGKRIDDDDYLNPDYYHRKLNDKIFNGNIAKSSNEINLSDADSMFRDSKGYRINKIVTDFMKDLPEQITKYYNEQSGKYGETFNVEELRSKLGQEFEIGRDGQRRVVLDPRTGQPKINMTDDVFTQALGNEYLMNFTNDALAEAGMPQNVKNQKQFLTQLLAGQDPNQIQRDIRLGFKKPERDIRHYLFQGGYGYTNPVDDIEERDKMLTRAVTSQGGDDVLKYFNNINKDVTVKYAEDQGKRVIKVEYPASLLISQEDWDKMTPQEKMLQASQKVMKPMILPISTEDERRGSKIFLSRIMDEIDRKRAIGQEYPIFIDEKRKKGKKLAADDL